jgi:hypothetical protein
MPDWKNEASHRLKHAKFSASERDDVSRELAGYLEDLCSNSRTTGDAESAAIVESALVELNEDPHLGVHLYRARKETNMNDRTKRFWLPGTCILLASALPLPLLESAGFSPYFPRAWAGNSGIEQPVLYPSLMIFFPWLCILPFLGAAGAYWSRRIGNGPALRIAVGIFPAFVFLATFFVWVPISAAIGALPPAKILLPALARLILSWFVIPGVALLLGVLPFLHDRNVSRRMA